MKVSNLQLRNYKGFRHDSNEISFLGDNGKPNDITVIIGKNASGKSSILQAIAMLVGGAVRPKFRPSKLDWPGFGYDSIESGNLPMSISCNLQFSTEEILATEQLAETIKDRIPHYKAPGKSKSIDLNLDYFEDTVTSSSKAALNQAKGYQYALQQPFAERGAALNRVGKVFWYHEQRTSSSILARANEEDIHPVRVDDNDLRTILGKWSNLHYRLNGKKTSTEEDPFSEFNKWFNLLFPGKQLVGAAPKRNPAQVLEAEDFWIKDDRNGEQYELANMSGAERAVFPILFDFVNWNIDNSIVLIDEMELHLHPPLQQTLLELLPKLGKNNQFIVTTHSPHILNSVAPQKVRVVKDFSVMELNNFTQGRDINSILTDVLELDERPIRYSKMLSHFYELLESEKIEEAQIAFNDLEGLWGTMDTEIVRARYFLEDLMADLNRSKEVLE